MGMAAILFKGAELFEKIFNIPSQKDQEVSEKIFIDFMILYLYIAQGQGQISPGCGVEFWS